MKQTLVKSIGWVVLAVLILIAPTFMVYSAIMSQSGLAVAQTSTLWNPLKDIAVGDGQTNGVGLFSPCLWNGTSCDRARGDTINGQQVNVTKMPATVGVDPVQQGTLFNSQSAGAANTALVVTIAGVANQRAHLYKITSNCQPAGTSTFTVQDGATVIYSAVIPSNPSSTTETWTPGLTASTGNSMVITANACGAGNQSVLNIQADQF